MRRAQKTLREIVRKVAGAERDCIIKRSKTGWFNKESYLDRITKHIGRLRQLGVPEYEKRTALAKCWRVYLNVQGMDDKNEMRDEKKVVYKEVLEYTLNTFDSNTVDYSIPEVRAHGLGYATVSWNNIYLTREAKDLGHYWNPGSGRRDKHGRTLSLEESDYWACRPERGST